VEHLQRGERAWWNTSNVASALGESVGIAIARAIRGCGPRGPGARFDTRQSGSYGPAVLPALREELAAELRALEDRGRLRACPPAEGHGRARAIIGGHEVISFSSNDYLGLAAHPGLARAAAHAAERSGFGASASRLISGDLPEHRELERALAAYAGQPAAVLFPTGYQANLGVVTCLARRGDLILSDAENHASLIDGCRLSRAEIVRYPHRDTAFLAATLVATEGRYPRRLIVTESLFSMAGDLAPVADLGALAHRHGAVLVVDEAHAMGVIGPGGAGVCRQTGVEPDALVGTLGKAFGTVGGFVAGTPELAGLLVNRARTFIFTTAPPPPLAAASSAALGLAAGPEGDQRRADLFDRIDRLHSALAVQPWAGSSRATRPPSRTPILPLILGSDAAAVAASRELLAAGFFVHAIRPPTVAEGTARLRLTLSAAHSRGDVDDVVRALGEILR
jgi:8-amino-7-oxononanoate synthase